MGPSHLPSPGPQQRLPCPLVPPPPALKHGQRIRSQHSPAFPGYQEQDSESLLPQGLPGSPSPTPGCLGMNTGRGRLGRRVLRKGAQQDAEAGAPPLWGRGRPSQTITAPPARSRLRAGAQSRGAWVPLLSAPGVRQALTRSNHRPPSWGRIQLLRPTAPIGGHHQAQRGSPRLGTFPPRLRTGEHTAAPGGPLPRERTNSGV